MKQEYRYIANNVRTGEVAEGSAKEVAKVLDCTAQTIRIYGRERNQLYQKTWKIEMIATAQDGDCNSLTEADLQKWDDFMKSVKKKSKKKVRLRKPQEVR